MSFTVVKYENIGEKMEENKDLLAKEDEEKKQRESLVKSQLKHAPKAVFKKRSETCERIDYALKAISPLSFFLGIIFWPIGPIGMIFIALFLISFISSQLISTVFKDGFKQASDAINAEKEKAFVEKNVDLQLGLNLKKEKTADKIKTATASVKKEQKNLNKE